MSARVEIARQQWKDGYRRLEAEAGDRRRYRQLLDQVEVLTDQLRRRIGGHFSLAELADLYTGAERWARQAVEERPPGREWPRWLAVSIDAAFHLYARGARDYEP